MNVLNCSYERACTDYIRRPRKNEQDPFNMKTLTHLALLGIALGSSSFMIEEKKKVAVVTCYVDKYMDTSELNGDASFAAGVATLAKDERFDLTSVLAKFHDDFFTIHAKEFTFDLLPEADVIGSEGYKNYVRKFGESDQVGTRLLDGSLPFPGYQVLVPNALKKENSNKMRMLELFKGKAEGVMFINLGFKFQPKVAVGGMGTAGIAAVMNIMLFNSEGEKVFNFVEYAAAKKSIPMVKGVPILELEKIKPLCEEAAENLMKDMLEKMPKLNKKIDKKCCSAPHQKEAAP